MATTDPKVNKSTTTAAAKPTASRAPASAVAANCTAWPPTSTWRVSLFARSAADSISSTVPVGNVQRRAREADAGEGDRAVLGDLERTERSVRAHHLRDARVTFDLGEEFLHAADDGRIVHCRLGTEHDLRARSGLLGKPVEQQVQRSLRLRCGRLEAARQGTTERRPAPGDEHERGQPPHEHEPAPPMAPSRQATQHGDPPSPRTTLNCTLDAMSKRRS